MPKFFATMPDGSEIIAGTTFTAGPLTVPASELHRLTHIRGGYGSEDVLGELSRPDASPGRPRPGRR